jgi:hypothetical protein
MINPLFVSLVVWLASLDQVWTTVRVKQSMRAATVAAS